MFEGNNKNNNEHKVIPPKKYSSGRSQFTRDKLQSDYHPKQRRFKAKLIKTETDHNKILQKLELDQQQAKIIERATQCFKNRQIIEIDWKTKSNFRKSNNSVRLPRIQSEEISRIKTQTLDNRYSYHQNRQSRLFRSANKLDNISSSSFKHKQVSNKLQKLRELILGSKNNIILQQNYHSIKINSKFQQQSNSIKKDDSVSNKSIHLNQGSQNIKQNRHDQIDFQKLRSKTGVVEPLRQKIDTLDDVKSQRSKRQSRNVQHLDDLSQATSSIQNQETKKQKQVIYEKYDILADPNVYILISKSRQKIMSFKEQVVMSTMTPLQKIQYLQHKKSEPKNQLQRINNSALSKSYSFKSRKQTIKRKFKQKRQKRQPEVSPFNEQNDSVKQNSISQLQDKHSSISFKGINSQQSIDEMEQKKWQKQQSRIKKKNESLIEVQLKLMKKVNLKFLKDDLANKFQQIRQLQNSNRVVV